MFIKVKIRKRSTAAPSQLQENKITAEKVPKQN